MKRIIFITGSRGAGKTTAVAHFPKPKELGKMVAIDTEDSFSDILESNKELGLEFGAYLRAYERFKVDEDMLGSIAKGKLPWVNEKQKGALLEYYQWIVSTLDKTLVKGKYKFLAIDTIEPIEAAVTAWAETNRAQSGWSGSKAYGRLETEGVRPILEGLFEAIARRGVETILLTSHLKRVWEQDRPVLNKVQPGGRLVVWSRLSSAMFWLVPNASNEDGAPAAIVLKARMGKTVLEGNKWVTKRVLPERIPHFTWDDVNKYQANPASLTNPAAGETMSDEEKGLISEFLTDQQMRLMTMGLELEHAQEVAQEQSFILPPTTMSAGEDERVLRVRAKHAAGESPNLIAGDEGMSLPQVYQIIKNGSS